MDDLKERLRSTESPFATAEKMARRMGCDFVLNDFGKSVVRAAKGTGRLRNPDGPEAAAYIEALEQRVSELEEALSDVRRRLEYGLRTTQIAGLDMQVSSSLGVIDAAINREPNP
jgi:hypothetical protein